MEPVRTGLRQLMSELLRARPAEEAVLLAWPLVCGKEVAARSQAIAFADGTLAVEVPDTTWRNQLQSFAPRYLSEFEGLLGPVVRSVEFKLKQSAASNQFSAPKRPAGTTKPLKRRGKENL
jgi:predicted nucleic acid-binding Zn ribbon protein